MLENIRMGSTKKYDIYTGIMTTESEAWCPLCKLTFKQFHPLINLQISLAKCFCQENLEDKKSHFMGFTYLHSRGTWDENIGWWCILREQLSAYVMAWEFLNNNSRLCYIKCFHINMRRWHRGFWSRWWWLSVNIYYSEMILKLNCLFMGVSLTCKQGNGNLNRKSHRAWPY